jgi:hypothetical protein
MRTFAVIATVSLLTVAQSPAKEPTYVLRSEAVGVLSFYGEPEHSITDDLALRDASFYHVRPSGQVYAGTAGHLRYSAASHRVLLSGGACINLFASIRCGDHGAYDSLTGDSTIPSTFRRGGIDVKRLRRGR